MSSIPIIVVLLIIAASYFAYRYLQKSIPERFHFSICSKTHDRFIEIISAKEPALFKRIDGKFMTIQKTSGEILQYFYVSHDLTDEELKKVNELFIMAFHQVK